MNTEYEIPLKIQIPFPHFDTFKWVKIREILNKFSANKITDFPSFEKDLQKLYNLSKNISPMKSFKILEIFFSKNISITEKFFKKTLSFLSNLALELPTLLPKPLPLLLQNTSGSLTFTKKQIACLIIHMFFGTITNSHGNPNFHEVINFGYILSNKGEGLFQKIGFLFNYFDRLVSGEIDFNRNISYVRIKGKKKSIEYWYSSKKNLNEVKILDIGGIEDIRPDTIQVDFANKYIGGGALLDGCVQEEIRFIINPECLPSMIIFECFKSDEVGYIIGTEQFCRYKGYGWDFAFDGNFEDKNSKLDSKKRMDVNILALDAICFYAPKKMEQFDESNLFREVNKAYIGG